MKIVFNLEGFFFNELSFVKHSTLHHPANICKAFVTQVCTFPLEPIKHSSRKKIREKKREGARERAQNKTTGCRKSLLNMEGETKEEFNKGRFVNGLLQRSPSLSRIIGESFVKAPSNFLNRNKLAKSSKIHNQ